MRDPLEERIAQMDATGGNGDRSVAETVERIRQIEDPDERRREIANHSDLINQLFEEPNAKIVPVSEQLLDELTAEQQRPTTAVPTFLPTWNKISRGPGGGQGVALGWFVILSGPSGVGKTLMTLSLMRSALSAGHHALFLSLEMSWKTLLTRQRAIVADEPIVGIEWDEHFDERRARRANRKLLDLPGTMYVNKRPIYEIAEMQEVVEVHKHVCDVDLVVVDYAQLAEPEGGDEQMAARVGRIAHELNYIAQEYDVACVAVSQRSQQGLYGSRQLKQAAVQILTIDKDSIEDAADPHLKLMDLIVEKNRHGPKETIPIVRDNETLAIRERTSTDTYPAGGPDV